ncbi:MAG: cupin domain-containing protein [Candidatus Izimaplasma sp.]|nr:cupin domain-containing protein [Candidatus Izimaplasma bacterium]
MIHFNLDNLEATINKRGVHAKTVVSHDYTTIKNLILEDGDVIPPHQVNVDVTFFILDGKGEITIGNDTKIINPNDVVLCPPKTPMSVKANQGSHLNFLNIKTPGIE